MIEWYCCSASCRHSRLVCIDGGGGARSRGGEPSGYSYRRSGFSLRLGSRVGRLGAWSTSSKEQQALSLAGSHSLAVPLARAPWLPTIIHRRIPSSISLDRLLSISRGARTHTHTHEQSPFDAWILSSYQSSSPSASPSPSSSCRAIHRVCSMPRNPPLPTGHHHLHIRGASHSLMSHARAPVMHREPDWHQGRPRRERVQGGRGPYPHAQGHIRARWRLSQRWYA